MPTVLRIGGYRFFFYAGDRHEPPHTHVEHDDNTAKFWLIQLCFTTVVVSIEKKSAKLLNSLRKNREQLLRKWDEYFSD